MWNSLFPPRHVYFPLKEHETTVIFLHDRNSTGPELAEYLAAGRIMFEHFPGTRWVFPSARAKHFYWTQADRQQLARNKKDNTTEWFELASLEDVQLESPGQLRTLQESATYVLRIIDDEIERLKRVGGNPNKIFIAGIGQGAALILVVLLCVHHELGGFVGTGGWMPFAETLTDMLEQNRIDEAGGFFKSKFIAAGQHPHIHQRRQEQQRPSLALSYSPDHPSPTSIQSGDQHPITESVTSRVVLPEHVKSMGVCLGRSTEHERVAQAASILERMGFSRVSWDPESKHRGTEDEAGSGDKKIAFTSETRKQLEEMAKLFKDLGLAS